MRDSTPKQGFTQKEALLVLEFITKCGGIEKPLSPLKTLAEKVMLDCFGWPIASGTTRLKKILQALEAENKIECIRSLSKRITGIRLKKLIPARTPDSISHASPAETEKEITEKSLPKPESHEKVTTKIPEDSNTKIHMQIMDCLGGRLNRKEIERRGNLYEDWLQISILGLLKVLEELFPEIVWDACCFRSGRHNPQRGLIDLQDHWGNDVSLHLTTRQNGRIVKGYIIYDSKGSETDVETFNSRIIRHPGQKGAFLKKAIWTNITHRSVKNLLKEILNDAIRVGLLPANLDKEKILERFED